MKNIIEITNFTKKIFASTLLTSLLATLLMTASINSAFAANTITLTPVADTVYGASPISITATLSPATGGVSINGSGACNVTGGGNTRNINITGAGTCTVTATRNTYDPTSVTFNIAKKDITIVSGDFAKANKTYDGTTIAEKSTPTGDSTVSGVTFSGVINGDNIAISANSGTATLLDRNATNTALNNVTFSGYTLATGNIPGPGNDESNYNLTNQPSNETQTVNKRSIIVTPSSNFSKVYDGNITSTGTPVLAVGSIQTGDTANFTQSYTNPNYGNNNKTLTAAGTVTDGNNGDNYNVTFAPTNNISDGSILKKELTVTGLTAENKIYDTTTNALGNGTPTLSGVLVADTADVIVGGSVIMNFINSSIGNAKIVNVTGLTISGTASGNYSLTQPILSANITAKNLTITGLSVANKLYDGLTTAIISGVATLVGVINTDQFNVRLGGNPITANFDTENASTSKLVTVTGYTASGTAAGNYNIITPTTTADITKRTLIVTVSAANKVYDANTNAVVTFSDNRVLGDSVTVTGTATFVNKTVGNSKTVTVTGITITGTDAVNYNLATTTLATTANITKKDLTASATSSSKTYDANILASSTIFSSDVINGDVVDYTFTSSSFLDKNVGVAKTVTVSGIALGTATDIANYNLLNTSATATADITARDLIVTSVATNKVYDGTTTAAISSLTSNSIFGDILGTIASVASNFINKNVGTNKLVTTDLLIGAGIDNSNYNLPLVSTTTANITKRTLNMLSASGTDKEYDGTRYGYAVISDDRISGDVIAYASTTSLFGSKNADNTKHITVRGITITGVDAGNYTLALPRNITTPQNVKVTKKAATIVAENKTKVYGDVDPALTTTTTGMIAGDNLTGSLVRNAGENVGTYDILSGTISAGNNYVTTFTVGTLTITKATPTIVITPVADKYTNSADFNVLATTASGLPITLSLTATSTPCTITGNTIHLLGATGTCQVVADVAGDTNHVAVSEAMSFNVIDVPVVVPPVTSGSFGGSLISSTNLSYSATVNTNNNQLQVLGASKFRFNKNLKLGMKNNNDVRELQKALRSMGLYSATSTNGNFDTELFNAVKAYQKINKVSPVSGFFGPLTRAVINK